MRNHDRAAANREPTRRLSLGTVLTAVNVGLVAAAVLCLVAAAGGLLRRLTDEQALARVSLASSNALRAIERAGEELRVSARLLAQGPILGRLVQERDTAGLQDLFARFRRTNNLSGCAVLLEGDPLARDGGAVPWGAIARLPRGADDRFVLRPAGDGPLVLGARAAVPSAPQTTVVTALVLDETFVRATSRQAGLPVTILDRQQAFLEAPQGSLRARALDTEEPVAERLDDAGLYLAVQPLRGPSGEVVGLVETGLPTAGLLPAQRRRQREAEAIVTGIVEGVFSVDRERRIRYLNPQAAAIVGLRPEEAIGRFCGDVLNPQGPEGVRPCEDRCPIVHARFRGSARATEDLLLLSGERRSVVITSAPADMERDGDVAGAGAPVEGARQFQVMRDETEVEATRRLRDTVLANITHEFRTPLTAQLASIELLRDRLEELKTEEARDLVASLQRGTLRLTQLIDNLLESVRIEAGDDSIRHPPVAIHQVVDEAVDLAAPLLALRDQKLSVDLPYPLPAVSGDAPRLVQVLVNLLANANKFAPAGSTIGIGGEVRGAHIVLWGWDEGPGLPPGGRDRPFRRVLRSPGEGPRGTGS